MSEDITKKQHYVWRHYLSAWKNNLNDKDIWTGLLDRKEVRKIGLMNVAQSDYFYKLENLTDKELDFLKGYSAQLSPNTKSIADIVFIGYLKYAQLNKDVAAGNIIKNAETEHLLKKIEANIFENIQSQIENLGTNLIKCQGIKELEKLAEESAYDILYYLLVQYTRTKAMKNAFVKSLSDRTNMQELANRSWPFFNLVWAMQLLESTVMKNDYRFVYVHNKGKVPFVAGDQPLINVKGNDFDDNGIAKDLELYYPLSPKTALVIEFTQGERFSEIDVDDDYVRQHNLMIAKEAQFHIFANEEGVLNNIIDEIRPL